MGDRKLERWTDILLRSTINPAHRIKGDNQ